VLSKRASEYGMVRDVAIRRNEDYGDYAERMRQRQADGTSSDTSVQTQDVAVEAVEDSGPTKLELDDLNVDSLEDEEE